MRWNSAFKLAIVYGTPFCCFSKTQQPIEIMSDIASSKLSVIVLLNFICPELCGKAQEFALALAIV